MPEPLDILIKTTADNAGADQTVQGLNKVGAAAQKASTEFRRAQNGGEVFNQSLKQTRDSAKNAGDAISQFAQRGSAAKDAYEGLTTAANGGAGAIFGIAKAWKNLTVAFAANPITAALAVVLGALTLIKAAIDGVVGKLTDMSKEYENSGKKTAEWKAAQEEQAKAAKQSLDAQIAKVETLSRDYETLIGVIDEVAARNRTINDAKRALELSKATTDEQRDEINARFDRAEIQSAADNAKKTIIPAANEQSRALQGQIDEATVAVKTAKTPSERQRAEENLAALEQKLAPEFRKVESQRSAAQTTLEVAPLKLQTLENNSNRATLKDVRDRPELSDTSGLLSQLTAAEKERDSLASADRKSFSNFKIGGSDGSKAIAEKDAMIGALREQITATENKNAEIEALFRKSAKNEKKTAEQLKNSRPGS